MMSSVKRLRAFGKHVATAQDEVLPQSAAPSEARARFLAPAPQPTRAERARVWASWGALAAAAAASVCLAAWLVHAPTSLVFDVGPAEAAAQGAPSERGMPGEWIGAPASERLPIRFSDGSVIRLESSSVARVVTTTGNGALVVLERGGAHADVVHRSGTRWNVLAGPFEVHVRGTSFEVGWDPVSEMFSVSLEQGSVSVSGCSLPRERVIAKGETFRACCREGQLALSDPAEDKLTPPVLPAAAVPIGESAPAAPSASAAIPVSAGGASIGPVPPSAPSVRPPAPDWRGLLLSGRYREAIEAADSVGLATICGSADAASLMELSDAARFAAHRDDAELVLRTVRRRFPDDERASVAAFHLGRIAFDDRGAYADGARWFETYLRERPDGTFAREASGRLIEALDRSGDHGAAKAAAKRYLAAFPGGPHTELARSLADR